MPQPPLDLTAAIDALGREHLKDISYSWPLENPEEPAHYPTALATIFSVLLPPDYRYIRRSVEDREFHQQLLQALQAQSLATHIARYLGADASQITDRHKAHYLYRLCRIVLDHVAPGAVERLLDSALDATPGYATFSLASDLWAEGLSDDRVTANWMATALLSTRLLLRIKLEPAATLAWHSLPVPHDDLAPVLRRCLKVDATVPLFDLLCQRLQSDFVHHATRHARRLTAREIANGELPSGQARDEPVIRVETILDRTPAFTLQAMLYSRCGQALGQAILADLEWLDDPEQHAFQRDLRAATACQAIADGLFPRSERVPAHVGTFNLFEDAAAHHDGTEIAVDLANHLSARFTCVPADAQWLTMLALRLQAPELLLQDTPADFSYEQSFRLVNLRHGLALNERPAFQLSFAEAEATPLLKSSLASSAEQRAGFAALRTPAIISWAEHHAVVPRQARYAPARIEALTLQYDALCGTAVLAEVPSRVQNAAQRLRDAGIAPYDTEGPNVAPVWPSKRPVTQVERYLDDGSDYSHPQLAGKRLPDPTQAFETLFAIYAFSANEAYRQLAVAYVQNLPAPHAERLLTGQLRFYAVHWHEYIGKAGGVPSRHTSDASDWRLRPSTGGLLVLAELDGQTAVYQLFPKQLTYQVMLPNASQQAALADRDLAPDTLKDLLPLSHAAFNLGQPLPYHYSALAEIVAVPASAGDNLAQCTHALVDVVLLARIDELEMVCRGQTPLEKTKAAWAARSDAEYAWRLIKNTLPFVGCADVHDANDTAACLLDILPDAGIRAGSLSRAFASAYRFGATKLSLGTKTMSRASRQIADWLAPTINNPIRQQLRTIGQGVPQGDFIQHLGMSLARHRPDQAPALNPHQRLATVNGAEGVLIANIGSDTAPVYRLQHAATQAVYGAPLQPVGAAGAGEWLSTRKRLGQGHYPALVRLKLGGDRMPLLPLEPATQVRLIERELGRFDVLIDGHHYQVDTLLAPRRLRKIEHVPVSERADTLDYTWVPCRRRRAPGLKVDPACVDHVRLRSTTPPPPPAPDAPGGVGILLSEAQAARSYNLERRTLPGPPSAPSVTLDLMVYEGKFVKWAPATAGPSKPSRPGQPAGFALQPLSQAELGTLGLPNTPSYRENLTARWSNDPRLGFSEQTDADTVNSLNKAIPHLAFEGISTDINDARIVRGHRVPTDEENYLVFVEVDDGRFFTAGPYGAQAFAEPDTLIAFRASTMEEAHQCIELNYSYAMVRNKLASYVDCDNVARLLFDIDVFDARKQGHALPDDLPASYDELAATPAMAPFRNHFQLLAQEILTSHASQGLYVKLVRRIIPDFHKLAQFPVARQQAVTERLNQLLPVSNKPAPGWQALTVENLGLESIAKAIFKNVGFTNLAFAEVTLESGEQLLYYALSGKKAARKMQLKLETPGQPRTGGDGEARYIDARRLMEDAPADPTLSSLPVLPDAANPKITPFPREQDSERFIATILRQDLLGAAANGRVVKEIHLFTLYDTCRTCGGVLMPRLRIDFPDARFSVSYLLDYDETFRRAPFTHPSVPDLP